MAEEGVWRKVHNRKEESLLVQCGELILPWLTPQELANVSITCKSLNKLSHVITLRRASDASRTFENPPIPFLNTTLDNRPYAYFLYTPFLILHPPSRQPWGSSGISATTTQLREAESVGLVDELGRAVLGCDCRVVCGDGECPCLGLDGLVDVGRECGPGCFCGSECGNRLSRKGVAVGVKIVKDERKGWSLRSNQFIPEGHFLFEYAGELLTTKEAKRRQQYYDELASHGRFSYALLVIREHLPSGNSCLRLNIDATRIGNVARYVNHSCDGGNLSTKLVRSSGALFPRLCFFASKDIQEDEELTFSYGEIRKKSNGLPCHCNSPSCFGTLPAEDT